MTYFYSILIVLNSWAVGEILYQCIKHRTVYKFLSSIIFIKNDRWNTWLGVNLFKLLVTKTIYGRVNRTIKLNSGNVKELASMKKAMIHGEIGHLLGFISAQLVFLIIYIKNENGLFFLVGSLINLLLNFYPVLLQQKNKSRIDKLLNKYCC